MPPFYLASGSPRRRELLTQVGVSFTVLSAPVDEALRTTETAERYVERLACTKAQAGFALLQAPGVVLGADTVVVLDGQVLGKPRDAAHAQALLLSLSGREHQVLTAVAVTDGTRTRSLCVASQVSFRTICVEEAQRYWASGEPADKAGGYAIQGLGAVFVSHLSGSYSAVVGLPLQETAALLGEFGIACWQSVPPIAHSH